MLRILRNKRAQTTAEYAILIGLVVAALLAMQTYVKRGLNAKMKDGTDAYTALAVGEGATTQYEPYYLNQTTISNSSQDVDENMYTNGTFVKEVDSASNRTSNQSFGWGE
jgi:Flp pilus assembly pilin Flp